MKTSVDIPEELWKAAKHLAIEKGVDLKEIIRLALDEYLRKIKKGGEKK